MNLCKMPKNKYTVKYLMSVKAYKHLEIFIFIALYIPGTNINLISSSKTTKIYTIKLKWWLIDSQCLWQVIDDDGNPSWGRVAFTGKDIHKISYIQNKKIHTQKLSMGLVIDNQTFNELKDT